MEYRLLRTLRNDLIRRPPKSNIVTYYPSASLMQQRRPTLSSVFFSTRIRASLHHLFILIYLGVAGAIMPAQAGAPEKRVALLVQNDLYPDAEPAKSVDDDASTLASSLKQAGFEVELEKNLSKQEMRSRVSAFVARLTSKSVALFYFKGIGIQVSRQTYMIPVDASIWSADDVRREGTSLDGLLSSLDQKGADVKIAIVDAARPNPFERRFRMYSAGLAPPSSPQGSLVIFADALNKVTDAGPGPLSPFMSELVKQLKVAGGAEDAFARTRQSVSRISKGRELPWVSSTLVAPFDLVPAAAAPAAVQSQNAASPSHAVAAASGTKPEHDAPPAKPSQDKPVQDKPVQDKPVQDKPEEPKPASLALHPGRTFKDCPHCPEMIVLAAARFAMGSGKTPFDRPVHDVTIAKPFAIARSVVTRDEWRLCVDEGGCTFRPDAKASADDPLVDVTWQDAKQYVAFLTRKVGQAYRLPTEAEWEYAARGGTTTTFAWGDSAGIGHADCLDCGNGGSPPKAEPVRRYPSNGFGLFDMAGNVAQWVEDCWTLTYADAPTNGSALAAASCKMRDVRGGSFETSSAYIKPTARFRAAADARSPSIGFRVARDVE